MNKTKWAIEKLLYPYMERKKGNMVRAKTGELIKNQSLDQAELLKLQEDKLRLLLQACVDDVPAYQEFSHLKKEIVIDPFGALKKFPILEKQDFRDNSSEYINKNARWTGLIPNRTGGSSGEPVSFFMDRATVEYYEAARWRGLSWWGISYGSPSIMIWGNTHDMSNLSDRNYNLRERWLKNRMIIPAFALNRSEMPCFVKQINRFKPEYFYGYASALAAFADLMEAQGLKLDFKLKAVVPTAETLHGYQRETMERVFEAPVVNEYGAKDGGIIAYECSKGNMHISVDNLVLEVVDPVTMEAVAPEEEGTFLVTDLNNYSQPRLRYKIGDMGAVSERKCDCGINLPILEKLSGRESEMLLTREGNLVHAFAFNTLARSSATIKRYKIVQESPEKAKLYILELERPLSPASSKSPEAFAWEALAKSEQEKFIAAVKEKFPGTEFEINIVDEIPLKASGKEDFGSRNFELR